MEAALANPDIYLDDAKPRLRELLDSQTRIKRQLDAAESAWLEILERLEKEEASQTA